MAFKLDYFARETMVSLRRNLVMTLAGILTVAVSLFLFGGVVLLSRMVDHGTARWKEGVELEVFFVPTATQQQIDDVQQELKDSPNVKKFRFISKKEALDLFKRFFADQPELVEAVDPDTLPPSFRVVPKDPELTETIAVQFRGRPGVDEVLTAQEQVRRMLHAISWIRRLFFAISGVLLLSSFFLIVNTIRLATYARRREIQIMKLVGATNWFIRIPFMLEGLVQGAAGAGLAFGAVYVLQQILSDLVVRSEGVFRSFFITTGDAVGIGLWVLVIGGVVGVAGSAIGLRRFLDV
ncbi:MAG: ABC transporter permease [Actinobacteria bacterium]|nr:ABC transporter permease [Actinomycetota bacterium]